jgi:hypothetical protein
MSDAGEQVVQFGLNEESMRQLEVCAAWRGMSVPEAVRAYVEDWMSVDYPESQGRWTRRSLYRGDLVRRDNHPSKL